MDQAKHSYKKRQPGRWRAYGWHAFLLAVLVIECLAAWLLHRDRDQLLSVLEKGSEQEQVEALFILTNRNTPMDFNEDAIQGLLNTTNPLIHEWIMSANFSRFITPEFKDEYIESLNDPEKIFRYQFFETHQVGKRCSMTLGDLSRFLDIREGP
jgi:hypothetical protein